MPSPPPCPPTSGSTRDKKLVKSRRFLLGWPPWRPAARRARWEGACAQPCPHASRPCEGAAPTFGSCGARRFAGTGRAGAAERDAAAPLMLVPWPLRRLGKRSVCADFESSVPVQSLSIRVNATTVLLMVWQNFVLLGNSGFGTRCCPPLCQIGAAFARQRASAVCVCSVVSCQYREALVVSCRCCGGTYSRMCKAQRSTALYNAHAWCSCSSSKCCP